MLMWGPTAITHGGKRQRLLRGLCVLVLALCAAAGASTPTGLPVDLLSTGRLYVAETGRFPTDLAEVPAWEASLRPARRVSLTGGAYWLVTEVAPPAAARGQTLVFNPSGTLIDRIEVRQYSGGGGVQRALSGYRADHAYSLHYGVDLRMPRTGPALLVARFESPYYASAPRFTLEAPASYRLLVRRENTLIFLALGALLTLGVYNLFLYSITRDPAQAFYAAYVLTYAVAWALTFHVFADLFGLHDLRLHYVGFFLLPVLNTLFYLRFLDLEQHFPGLARLSRVNLWLPLLLLPACFVALPAAHLLATGVISVWLLIALVCGVATWRRGYAPARYFVLAFLALLVPAGLILPGNAGLLPDVAANTELLTLLGGTLDGLLLAFALADRIRVLQQERGLALQAATDALRLAQTDALTGIGNRYAFDRHVAALVTGPEPHVFMLLDLDGFKRLNDEEGHERGDGLLRDFAASLRAMEDGQTRVYRLGGDEFGVLAPAAQAPALRAALSRLRDSLRTWGYDGVDFSAGSASTADHPVPADLCRQADRQMYRDKQAKPPARLRRA